MPGARYINAINVRVHALYDPYTVHFRDQLLSPTSIPIRKTEECIPSGTFRKLQDQSGYQ